MQKYSFTGKDSIKMPDLRLATHSMLVHTHNTAPSTSQGPGGLTWMDRWGGDQGAQAS